MRGKIFLVCTIVWMGVIFLFSSRNESKTTQDSNTVGEMICENFMEGYNSLNEDQKQEKVDSIDFVIRKSAHATEYAILAILVFGTVYDLKRIDKRFYKLVLAWGITVMYATTDEIHQLFVPGRSGKVTDVCIDGLGALLGLSLCVLVLKLIKNIGNK